jgi:MerR family transcriptional regulator, copper efflux regulator
MRQQLTIGRLAAAAQVPTDTIRYYESIGLLPPPERSPAGYRLYPRTEVRRLQLIRQAKLLGLSLEDIKDLVDETFTGSCEHLQRELLQRIPAQLSELERRMDGLRTLELELRALENQLTVSDITGAQEMVADCAYCPVVEGTAGQSTVSPTAERQLVGTTYGGETR